MNFIEFYTFLVNFQGFLVTWEPGNLGSWDPGGLGRLGTLDYWDFGHLGAWKQGSWGPGEVDLLKFDDFY